MIMDARAAQFPRSLEVHVLLDDAPHYKGSIHDDEVARARGYKAALIPGAFVYGHMSRLAVDAWGLNWVRGGRMSARFKRPVYNRDDLVVAGGALNEIDGWLQSDVTVTNGDGEEVAVGQVAMPLEDVAVPEMTAFDPADAGQGPMAVEAGAMPIGRPIGGRQRLLTEDEVQTSRRGFAETHPAYRGGEIVHPGMLMRLAMGETNAGFKFPAAIVLTSIEAEHFALVRPGQTLQTLGRIAEDYERKGKHYFVSDELMLADGQVAARFRRTQIYG